jgi:pyruvate/2-oxoglutarate dehydrogenase complex dihydrolipoamide dehydrogenase (E3) component
MRGLTAGIVITNTGARPPLPPLPGLANAAPLDSESAQNLDRVPDHPAILGGGNQ